MVAIFANWHSWLRAQLRVPWEAFACKETGTKRSGPGAEITANGGRGSFTNFMIDGLDDRDQSVGTVKVFPLVEGNPGV